MAALWEQRYKRTSLERLAVVEDASRAALGMALDDALRDKAHSEAHNLAGSLGMFGFVGASDLAQHVEYMFEAEAPLGAAKAIRLSELVADLRRALDDARSEPGAGHDAQER